MEILALLTLAVIVVWLLGRCTSSDRSNPCLGLASIWRPSTLALASSTLQRAMYK
jgi:hypothetical protein